MIWKGVIAAIALAFLLAGGAVRADELALDKWVLYCTTDAMTDKQSCKLMYLSIVPGVRPDTHAAVNFGWIQPGEIFLYAGPGIRNSCPEKPTMLRVDKKPAVTLNAVGSNYVLRGGAAREMAEQFKAGNSALMRVYVRPRCTAIDMTVSLKGFTTAWKRFEAAGG